MIGRCPAWGQAYRLESQRKGCHGSGLITMERNGRGRMMSWTGNHLEKGVGP